MRDGAELLQAAWEDVAKETIARRVFTSHLMSHFCARPVFVDLFVL